MKTKDWVKLGWGALIVAMLTYFLWERLPDLLSGKAAAADIVVFGVWMALLLSPLFTEVELLGVTLKREIEELKDEVTTQIGEIRTEIRNAVDVKTTVAPVFNIPQPPKDSELPKIIAEIKAAVSSALTEHGAPSSEGVDIGVPSNVAFLFATRFNMEVEIRRIAGALTNRPQPAYMIIMEAAKAGLVERRLAHAVQDAYRVCTPAVHGAPISKEKVDFVREVAPELIAALRAIPTPETLAES